jgi:hypothetical protein
VSIREDIGELRNRIGVPAAFQSARWTVVARGVADNFVPGPTDTVLSAWLPIGDEGWNDIDKDLGEPGPPATIAAPDASFEVLPEAVRASRVRGPSYPIEPFKGFRYQSGRAIRLAGGVLVVMYSA